MNLREKLANLEHEQWMKWASSVMDEVGEERQKRWRAYMIPYGDLSEKVKDYDRKWADKILAILQEVEDEEEVEDG